MTIGVTPKINLLQAATDIWVDGFNTALEAERERILALKKEIINCVIDYALTPEKYERVCNDIDALMKGENK